MQFKLHYRHRTGHRHIMTVTLTQLELERGISPKAVMEERLPNIFQSSYIVGLELVEIKPERVDWTKVIQDDIENRKLCLHMNVNPITGECWECHEIIPFNSRR